MKLEVTRKRELISGQWSGGTTTQLAIFPKDASYTDRTFQFRISVSEVSADESVFTFLPGVSRVLLVLEGELRINHPGRYVKVLKKFDSDTFMGDWQTRCSGRATDFNLMTTGSIHGYLEGIRLKKGSSRNIELSGIHDVAGIYSIKGDHTIEAVDHKVELSAGDNLLLFTDNKANTLRISAKTTGELVLAEIQF
jgi:environmental stress-induced protein Ves